MKRFIFLILPLFAILVSCGPSSNDQEMIDNTKKTHFHIKYGDNYEHCFCVITFEQGGHKWYYVKNSGDLHHHPDCKCNKKELKTNSLFEW